jgi:biopolymer transport protein ExbD
MRARIHQPENLQFQIAPMVDIIFILILFFMVSAGSIKVENEMSIRLPGTVQQTQTLTMIDEQIIQIQENGQVVLNDQPYDGPGEKELPQLLMTLKRFREMSDAAKTPALITVMSAPNTKYERVIDVLNVCTAAKISDVTFTTSEGS